MEVYLIRHTKPQVQSNFCYGHTDLPLADSFPEEWISLQKLIPPYFDAVYSSPLKRCHELAKLIKTKQLMISEYLKELNFGDWEMKEWDKIDQLALGNWMNSFVETRVPGGESFRDLSGRVDKFFVELNKASFETVAVVSHAGTIRTILANILGMPLQNAFHFDIDYGSVTCLKFSGEMKRIKVVNLK
ncbi:MAG: alpha-ribazole phosphatase [Omnitrophica WOR_2 bacterium RIFCSPHIGHO2_01_FULL_48_9]|nr:MAG: alpha-ribazole phosphatase [Omnitrophica WOR_2 bacterium RIFCSPHIGHO2_02_FULL_48_11]OGX34333.1 MAG: alpha-ribazole phosphatase [Omnitrophica WOR_2 bacterium RIFCSPHIGHO2_01_FULL_48_9]